MEPWHYIALLGAVIAVWALGMPRNKTSNPPEQSVKNMETALEQFMENMEKDNEELLQMLAKSQADAKQEAERKDGRIAALEQRCETLSGQLQQTLDKLAQTSAAASKDPAPHVSSSAESAVSAAAGVSDASTNTAPQSEAEASIQSAEESDNAETRYEDGSRSPHSIADRYAELFRLYREGKSIESIAKKLGMNKGEVQLIIGLAKQEGAHV